MRIDVFESEPWHFSILLRNLRVLGGGNVHTGSASGDLATLFHAFKFAPAFCFVFAFHVVVIERSAAGANEEGCAQKRC